MKKGRSLLIGMLSALTLGIILSPASLAANVTGTTASTTAIPTLPTAASSVQLSDGRILIAGGLRDQTALNQLSLYDPTTQRTTVLATTLLHARSQHSASVLPDGRVLIFGGIGANGDIVRDAEWFDPKTQSIQSAGDLGLSARAGHTATVLTDGSLLLVGGVDGRGQSVSPAELWNPRTGQLITSIPNGDRNDAGARLLSNGDVLISGGKDSQGQVLNDGVVFDAARLSFRALDATAVQTLRQASAVDVLSVMAQLPPPDSVGFAPDGVISLRFSRPVDPSTVNAQTVTVLGPNGATLANIVVAEGGMLVFITPNPMLAPGSLYSVFVKDVKDSGGAQTMSLQAWTFRTAGLGDISEITLGSNTGKGISGNNSSASSKQSSENSTAGGAKATPQQAAGQAASQSHTALVRGVVAEDDEEWIPGPQNYKGEWRSHRAELAEKYPPLRTETQRAFLRREMSRDGRLRERDIEDRLPAVTLSAAPEGVTAIAGQILRLNGKPLAGVTLSMGAQKTVSDGNGEFLLTNVPSGENQVLSLDGQSASTSTRQYGRYDYLMHVVPGKVTAMPAPVWLAKLDTAHAVKISSPTTREVVVTNPRLPGLELHIPAGTVIRDVNGKIVTEISITPVPSDQLPFPMPYGDLPVYYTIQPGGAVLQSVTGQPQGASLVYPNYSTQPHGAKFQLFGYDPKGRGWYTYGMATVSADDKHIESDKGFTIYQFTATSAASSGGTPPAKGPKNCSGVNCNCPSGSTAGDPVSCHDGLFMEMNTDLTLRDVVPLALTRTYRNEDANQRSFGVGSSHRYDLYLYFAMSGYTATEIDLVLPSGGRIPFNVVGTNTAYTDAAALYESLVPGEFYKAKLQISASGWGHYFYITLKNGTRYAFNYAPSKLMWIQDRYGNRIAITRDGSNRISRLTSPDGRTMDFQYTSANCTTCITQATDNTGRFASYAYDTAGRLTKVTDAAGGATQYTYDVATHRMLTITDPRLNTKVTNVYYTSVDGVNLDGRVKNQTYADLNTSSFAYTFDLSGTITQTEVTNERGKVRRIEYNGDGFITRETLAAGLPEQQVTVNNWDPATKLLNSTTDTLNRTTTYAYDAKGNVKTVTRLAGTPDAVKWNYNYDLAYNQIASVTDPLIHTTSLTYDILGSLTQMRDALGNASNFTYNGAGQPVTLSDALGNTTQLSYDFGDLSTVTDPLVRTTSLYTDPAGRVASRTDPLGNRSRLDYDSLDRVRQLTDALGGITALGYDPSSNLTTVTDTRGGITAYGYDPRNRLASRTDPLLKVESNRYDGNGNLISRTDRKGQVTGITYDGLNRPIQTTYADLSTVTNTYDAGNRLIQIVDSVSGTITRSYDGLDRLTQEISPKGTVNYTYDTANRRTSMTVVGQPTVNYSYDTANRLTQITQGTSTTSFSYDAVGRRTSLTLPNGILARYSYDAASQLTAIQYTQGVLLIGDLTYAYDAAGQRVQMGGSLARTGLPTAVTAAYNAANQLTQWGATVLSYDANGNMLNDGLKTYSWNARNQLASLSSGASFSYDASGRRLSKTVSGVQTGFLYDGINPVQELAGSTPKANLLTGLGTDEVFTRTTATGTRNFMADALGSPLALTDATGAIQTQYSYEPYGNTTASGAADDNAFQYTGRENDGTGLYFYRARYYSPTLQRFVSEDPIGLAGGMNTYAYVGGNPLRYTDPMGLDWKNTVATLGCLIGLCNNSPLNPPSTTLPDPLNPPPVDAPSTSTVNPRPPTAAQQCPVPKTAPSPTTAPPVVPKPAPLPEPAPVALPAWARVGPVPAFIWGMTRSGEAW